MIEVEHLNKKYGQTQAISDVTFTVEKGEILGLLGPNGAGKTTTMRILTGYIPATAGKAKIAGYDVYSQSLKVRRNIGYLPENPPLYPEMTVEGFLYFVASIKGVAAGSRPQQVQWAIERCQLTDRRKMMIRKLSQGYRQRVGIAQAIVHQPPVIILDEPTVGLDPRQIIEVRNLIKSLAGEHTIILSSHILPEVSHTCDRVTIINRGQVVATDTPTNLYTQLSATSGYQLEVEGEVTAIKAKIENISGVTEVEIKPDNNTNRSKIKINTSPETEPGKEIAATIIQAGLGLYEMKRDRPTLEEVFLQLTTTETTELERKNDG